MTSKQKKPTVKKGIYSALRKRLTNFIHSCDTHEIDFEAVLEDAYRFYRSELKETYAKSGKDTIKSGSRKCSTANAVD